MKLGQVSCLSEATTTMSALLVFLQLSYHTNGLPSEASVILTLSQSQPFQCRWEAYIKLTIRHKLYSSVEMHGTVIKDLQLARWQSESLFDHSNEIKCLVSIPPVCVIAVLYGIIIVIKQTREGTVCKTITPVATATLGSFCKSSPRRSLSFFLT